MSVEIYESDGVSKSCTLSRLSKALGYELSFIASENVVAAVGRKGSDAFVCIRGSDDLTDWRYNFELIAVDSALFGSVHSGFEKQYNILMPLVREQLGDVRTLNTVTITGHSLGGALGLLVAFDLQRNIGLQPEVITFAQPRVGRGAFIEQIGTTLCSTYARFVNPTDPVPRLPFGFQHCGQRFLFGSNNAPSVSHEPDQARADDAPMTEAEAAKLWPNVQRALDWSLRSFFKFFAWPFQPALRSTNALIRGHDMGVYLEKVRKIRALNETK